MWDFSSQTGNQTGTPYLEGGVLTPDHQGSPQISSFLSSTLLSEVFTGFSIQNHQVCST